jgi:hypothetical protein
MRWRLLGLLFFAIAGAVAWVFWVRPEAEIWVKEKIEETLSHRFQQEVHLDSLSIHPLLLRVVAQGVRVGPSKDPLFTCNRWTFYTSRAAESPFSFLLFTFARSELDQPSLRLPLTSNTSFRLSPRWWRDLPLHGLTWHKGSLEIPLGPNEPALSFTRAEGAVQLSPGGALFKCRGASSLGDFEFSLKGYESLRLGAHLDVRGEGTLAEAPLNVISSLFPNKMGRVLGTGTLSVKASVHDLNVESFTLKDLTWAINARLKNAIWFPPSARPKDLGVPLEGELSFRNGRLDLREVLFFHALVLSGTVITGSPGSLNLSWKGKEVLLSDLAESGVGFFHLFPQRGTVGTEGTITGTLDRPAVTWKGDFHRVGYPGFLLPPVSLVGQWKDEWFSLKTEGRAGQLEIGGTLPASGSKTTEMNSVWTLRASNLDLSSLAHENGWPRVRGLMNGSFSLLGVSSRSEGNPPKAEGTLRIDDFSWGVHQETAPVQGRLSLTREGLRIQGAQKNFDLEIRRSSGVWQVDHLDYDAGGLQVWGRGHLLDKDGKVQLEGGVTGLRLGDLPPLAKRFPSVEGHFDLEGHLNGGWEDPIFTGTIRVEQARWRSGGLVHQGKAELRGGRGGMTVPRFEWDDHVWGEGAWLFGKGGRFSVEAMHASGEELFDFFVTSKTVGGIFSGKASLSSSALPGWVGWGRLTGEKGHWGDIPFDETKAVVYFKGSHIDLESVEVKQKEGSFHATGNALLRPLNTAFPGLVWSWHLSGESTNFGAGSLGVSGLWDAQGESRSREGTGAGEFRGIGVTLEGGEADRENRVSIGDVRAKFSWSPTLWRLDDLSFDRGGRGQGTFDRDTGKVTGQMEIKELSLDALFPRLWKGAPLTFGRLNGAGTLTGAWSDPNCEIALDLEGAGWKEANITGDVRAVWKEGWTIPHFSLHFEDKAISLKGNLDGTIDLGLSSATERTLSLEGQIQKADEFPLKWHSRWDITASTLTVQEALLTTAEGLWRLRPGSLVTSEGHGVWGFRLENDIRNIHLGPLQIFGGVSLVGQFDSKKHTVAGRIKAKSLWINQRVFDNNIAQFHLSTATLSFVPREGESSSVQGSVRLDRWPQTFFENLTFWDSGKRILVFAGELGPAFWDFSMEGWGLQAETLLSLADFDWPISGPWTVKVRGRGSLKAPEVQADISGGPGQIGPLPYDRLEAEAHWVGDRVDVKGMRLSRRKGYVLKGDGRFPVRSGAGGVSMGLDLHLTDGNLAVLKEVWPLCRGARGSFFGDLNVTPGERVPEVTGSFHIKDGRLDLFSYAPRVRQVNAEILLKNDLARVEHARARVGSGWIEMAGDIGINGLSPVEYDLSIESDGSRGVAVEVPQLSVPPGPVLGHFSFFSEKLKGISYGEPQVSLRVKGLHGQHLISGTALLEETHFTYPPDKEGFHGIPGPSWWRNFWRQAAWDIRFKTGKETWYRNEYVNVRLDGGLHLAGQPGAWTVNGRVGSTEGAINYLGQLFQVKRGDFEVTTDKGSGEILPFVSGEAERVVTTVDPRGLATDDTISMVVDRALLGEIQPRFVSRNNPDLKSERVAMKALGLSSEQQGTPADRDQLFRAGLVQLVGSSAAPLANRLAQKLGIGMISPIYEPPPAQETAPTVAPSNSNSGTSAKVNPVTDYLRGAGASARIRLTDRLSGVYKVKLDEAKNQTYFRDQIELILRVKGSLYLRASSELDSQSLLGQPPERRAVLENQWRFGLPKRKKKKRMSEPEK